MTMGPSEEPPSQPRLENMKEEEVTAVNHLLSIRSLLHGQNPDEDDAAQKQQQQEQQPPPQYPYKEKPGGGRGGGAAAAWGGAGRERWGAVGGGALSQETQTTATGGSYLSSANKAVPWSNASSSAAPRVLGHMGHGPSSYICL